MSKYFEQTRRAGNHERAAVATRPDMQNLLEVVAKNTGAAPREVLEDRLGSARKIRLPFQPGGMLLSPGNETTAVALEAYRALRTRLLRAQAAEGLHSVVLTSAMTGEGKTLTTMNLGLCCAQLDDCRVLLIDSDLRTSGLSRLAGISEGVGLSDVLAGRVDFSDAIAATDLPNLFVLSAGTCEAPAPELFASNRWKELLDWCKVTFRLILVDSPPLLPVADFEQIVSCCDNALIVVRALKTERELLKKASERIDPKKMLGVVFNGASVEANGYYGYGSNS
jgi:protein-tyrosine kinase